jgi:hypothetical protein
MAHLDRVILVPLLLFACGSPETVEPATHEGQESTVAETDPTREAVDETVEETPAPPPIAEGDSAVLARVVDSGPIGSGDCVQCSHRIVVEAAAAGDLAASADPLWVHYESCADRPMPPRGPGTLNPCSLDEGSSYDLTLRPGASPNFGDAFMIVEARPH